jgi:branched-chain amino acid aminotransferase
LNVITYVNGEYVPHEEAKISVDDRGIMFGDSVFDITRTFDGVVFRLDDHLERLRKSMRYVELDGDGLLPGIRKATEEVLGRNAEEIKAVGDVLVEQIVTRGGISPAGADSNAAEPTVIVKLRALYFSSFAQFYKTGIDLHVSLLTSPFAGPMDPRVKAANRLANTRAELKGERMRGQGKGHWTVIFNADGTIAETHYANLVIVSDGKLLVPPAREVLGGISLMTLTELARDLGIAVGERPLTSYDIINADEAILTATSFSLLPVVALDGIPLSNSRELYSQLQRAWIDLVGVDFVAQAEDWAARSQADMQDKRPAYA